MKLEWVIPVWNEFPQKLKEAKILNRFKTGLDKERTFLTWRFTGIYELIFTLNVKGIIFKNMKFTVKIMRM